MVHSWCIVVESASSSCLQSLYEVFSLLFCRSQHKTIPCYSMLLFIVPLFMAAWLYHAVSGVFKNGIARKHENGTVLWQPTMRNGSYAEAYRFKPFGTTKVEVDGILQDIHGHRAGKAMEMHPFMRFNEEHPFEHTFTSYFGLQQGTFQTQSHLSHSQHGLFHTFPPSRNAQLLSAHLPRAFLREVIMVTMKPACNAHETYM